jgi:hypothetical protein
MPQSEADAEAEADQLSERDDAVLDANQLPDCLVVDCRVHSTGK